ncbi:MAG: hypothetical protein JST26_03620 [Bacteroidetes bacterium]|nr:hypothetical protein [Bacteroidota bacterium]
MQVIGERSSILKKENLLSLVILPTSEKRKVNLMFLWLFLWTVSGFIIFANYFKLTNVNAKLFVIIWLGFWAYFEFKIARVFLWKRFGKEKLWIKDGTVFYQREISGRGKIKKYDLNLIETIDYLPLEKGNFADVFNQSFWVKGGERLEFICQSKRIRFGMQLKDDEAKTIQKELNKFIKSK